jgi:uncharacterized protein YndB with AHSA1/START domain
MENGPIIIEREFNVPVERVWKAITNKNEMKKWYFDFAEFKPETGFEFSFIGGDEKKYVHLCRITEVDPERKLSYTWRYEGFEGTSKVSFLLTPENGKTILTLTHAGLETFPSDNSDFDKKNFVDGWTYIIGTSLKDYLEKQNSNSGDKQ